ncbi:MAG: hypothetical protein JST81_09750 [Bacteroidetes bacterium]|nr:hypothetical protein [Bacteroidota bacterium]
MFSKIKKSIINTFVSYKKIDRIYERELNDYKNAKVNLGQIQAAMNNQKTSIQNLNEVEFQVFSQFGDDGIIQYLVNKLPITNKTFIEFGVENFREANTRFLLVNNYWSGMVIDGSDENMAQVKREQLYPFYDLRAVQQFITKENINELMASAGFHKNTGILSIDIDGNDYWVWKELNVLDPDIIICEYNSLFGFNDPVTIPYDAGFIRGKKTPFNLYGTSLKAAQLLAKERGYFFIGCNSAGNNAYFIKEKFRSVCPVQEKSLEEGYNLAVFSESWNAGEPRRGRDKVMSIHGQKVIDVTTMQEKSFDAAAVVDTLMRSGKFRGIH